MQEEHHQLLNSWLDGECSPAERQRVEALLKRDDAQGQAAREEMAALERTRDLLRQALRASDGAPPRDFSTAFRAQVQVQASLQDATSLPSRSHQPRRGLLRLGDRRWFPAAAAAMLMLGVFIGQYGLDMVFAPPAEQGSHERLADFSAPSTHDRAHESQQSSAEIHATAMRESAKAPGEESEGTWVADNAMLETESDAEGDQSATSSEYPPASELRASPNRDSMRKKESEGAADALHDDEQSQPGEREKLDGGPPSLDALRRRARSSGLPVETEVIDRETRAVLARLEESRADSEQSLTASESISFTIASESYRSDEAFERIWQTISLESAAKSAAPKASSGRRGNAGGAGNERGDPNLLERKQSKGDELVVSAVRDHGDYIDYELEVPRDRLGDVVARLALLQVEEPLDIYPVQTLDSEEGSVGVGGGGGSPSGGPERQPQADHDDQYGRGEREESPAEDSADDSEEARSSPPEAAAEENDEALDDETSGREDQDRATKGNPDPKKLDSTGNADAKAKGESPAAAQDKAQESTAAESLDLEGVFKRARSLRGGYTTPESRNANGAHNSKPEDEDDPLIKRPEESDGADAAKPADADAPMTEGAPSPAEAEASEGEGDSADAAPEPNAPSEERARGAPRGSAAPDAGDHSADDPPVRIILRIQRNADE